MKEINDYVLKLIKDLEEEKSHNKIFNIIIERIKQTERNIIERLEDKKIDDECTKLRRIFEASNKLPHILEDEFKKNIIYTIEKPELKTKMSKQIMSLLYTMEVNTAGYIKNRNDAPEVNERLINELIDNIIKIIKDNL